MKFIKFTTLFLLLLGSIGFAEDFNPYNSSNEVDLYVYALKDAISQVEELLESNIDKNFRSSVRLYPPKER